jgi:putative hydrolase of HD superfamily
MKTVADLLFQANLLKKLSRSGYRFLGAGRESVADHSFTTAFVALVLTRRCGQVDALRLISLCLVHDLLEARTGDLDHVQKSYVAVDQEKALADTVGGLSLAPWLRALIREYDQGHTLEARLARDADRLSLALELKYLADGGHEAALDWLANLLERMETDSGRALAGEIMATHRDDWWRDDTIDTAGKVD